jgi:hypothetical protein
MKGIVVLDLLIRIEMKPPLSSLLGRPCVPGKTQGLEAPSGKGDQVLLERFEAEGVGNLVLLKFALRSVGSDQELFLAFEEDGGDSVVGKGGIVKITQDCTLVGDLHGQIVVGVFPKVNLPGVALDAGLSAHKGGCCDRDCFNPR